MKPKEAALLLCKLRGMGVELRVNAEGVMQYRDCRNALTEAQEGHLQRHRAQLTAALIREQTAEAIAEHLPDGMILPCFGRLSGCVAFTREQMMEDSASEFSSSISRRTDVCGDCTLFHAQYDLALMQEKREIREARQWAQEKQQARLRQNYFEAEAEEENER